MDFDTEAFVVFSVILDFLVGADGWGTPKVKETESLTCSARYRSQYADIKHLFVLKTSTHTCF